MKKSSKTKDKRRRIYNDRPQCIWNTEDIYSVESRETITNFVNTNIDEIRNCFDCFVLEKMPNHIGRKKDAEMMLIKLKVQN